MPSAAVAYNLGLVYAQLLTGPLHLPAGAHRLHIERGGVLAADRDVNVPLAKTTTVSVSLEPTPDTRAKYVSSAESRRTWSWATLGAGVVVAAGGAIFAVVEQGRLPGARRDVDAVNADSVRFSSRSCDFSMPLTSDHATLELVLAVTNVLGASLLRSTAAEGLRDEQLDPFRPSSRARDATRVTGPQQANAVDRPK